MLQASCHKLPAGPGRACGPHHPSENCLQTHSGFNPKKLPEGQAGYSGPDPGLARGSLSLHSWAGLAEVDHTLGPAWKPQRPQPIPPVALGSPKLSLDLIRDRAEDQLGMPRRVDVQEVQFTNIQWHNAARFSSKSALSHLCAPQVPEQARHKPSDGVHRLHTTALKWSTNKHTDEHRVKNPKP